MTDFEDTEEIFEGSPPLDALINPCYEEWSRWVWTRSVCRSRLSLEAGGGTVAPFSSISGAPEHATLASREGWDAGPPFSFVPLAEIHSDRACRRSPPYLPHNTSWLCLAAPRSRPLWTSAMRYSPKWLEKLSEKGFEQRSEHGFGR